MPSRGTAEAHPLVFHSLPLSLYRNNTRLFSSIFTAENLQIAHITSASRQEYEKPLLRVAHLARGFLPILRLDLVVY